MASPARFSDLVRSALDDTKAFFGGGRAEAIRSAILIAAGSGIYWIVLRIAGTPNPKGAVMGEILHWLSYVLIPAAVLGLSVFLWNLWLAPYRIVRQRLSKMEGDLDFIREVAEDIQGRHQRSIAEVTAQINDLFEQHRKAIEDAARQKYDEASSNLQAYNHEMRVRKEVHDKELSDLAHHIVDGRISTQLMMVTQAISELQEQVNNLKLSVANNECGNPNGL